MYFNDIHMGYQLEKVKGNLVMAALNDYHDAKGVSGISGELISYGLRYENRYYIDNKHADTYNTKVTRRRQPYYVNKRITYLRGVNEYRRGKKTGNQKVKRITYKRRVKKYKQIKIYSVYRNAELISRNKGFSETSRLNATTHKRFNPKADAENYRVYNDNINYVKDEYDTY